MAFRGSVGTDDGSHLFARFKSPVWRPEEGVHVDVSNGKYSRKLSSKRAFAGAAGTYDDDAIQI